MRWSSLAVYARSVLLVIGIAALLNPGAGRDASTLLGRPAPAANGRPIVLIGIDAGDWLPIDRLIRAGKLPALARLRAEGRTGIMLATPPLVSPMIWTTIATGVEPENHGILDFMTDTKDGRQIPVGSSDRLSPALWNLFSAAGRSVAAVGWWATWPAEDVHGTIVSDALAPQLTRSSRPSQAGLVSPPPAAERINKHIVRPTSLTRDDLSAYVPLTADDHTRILAGLKQTGGRFYDDPLAHLSAIVAGTRTYAAIAEDLLRTDRPDFLAVYFEAVDTISHLFVRDATRGPRAIDRAYEDIDAIVARLANASTPDTVIVVCSDHGFYSTSAGITVYPSDLTGPATAWHRPYGIVGVALAGTLASQRSKTSNSIRTSAADLGVVTPVDIAPTLLHAAGLPISSAMAGRVVAAMILDDRASVTPARAAAQKYSPPRRPESDRQGDADAIRRLQALGYIGTTKTSLARQNLGESLFRRGKLAAAERELRAVAEAQPRNLSVHLWLSQTLERQGRVRESLVVYEHAMTLPEGPRDGLIQAVDVAVRAGDMETARRLSMLPSAPQDVRSVARGAVAEATRDTREAERFYRAALQADPLSFDAAARLVDLLGMSGRTADAKPLIERAAQLAPDSARHLALLGQVRLASQDVTGADVALRRALALAPDAEPVRIALGRLLLMRQKAGDAIEMLRPLPQSPDRDALLGSAYSAQRDWGSAITHLQAAVDGGRVTPEVLNALGWAQLQAGQKDAAAATLTRSLGLRSNQPQIRQLLRDIQRKSSGQAR